MSFLSKIFSKHVNENEITVDMHSHVLHSLDDGSESIEDSIELLKELQEMGYKKLIATPHIMGDFFKNSPTTIHPKLEELRKKITEHNIDITLDAAAEYYLDEWFMEKLRSSEKFLTFGDSYLLFELSYINPSPYLTEAIFLMKSQGYKPVLAHPERYVFWHGDITSIKEVYEKGVILQVNINSLTGYYNKGAQKTAELLIDLGIVQMFGSDCHGIRHIEAMKEARRKSYYKKALPNLINNNLFQ